MIHERNGQICPWGPVGSETNKKKKENYKIYITEILTQEVF